MQLYPILLIVIVLAADGGVRWSPDAAPESPWQITAIACLPVVVIVAFALIGIALCDRRMVHRSTPRPIGTAERLVRYGRMALIANHAVAVFMFGWLDAVRAGVGDIILVDELLAIAPPLLGVLALWWAYYPIEQRIRETLLVRRLDMGKPVYPMPSRWQYVGLQARTGMLLLLVPIVVILGLSETVQVLALRYAPQDLAGPIINSATLAAAALVFVCAPLLMRLLLNVEPLSDGPVRDELEEICRRHRVSVRELLLWKTGGSMINAAVMGLLGRLRFVLVTDALLETMSTEQVKAVMAHEIGHVRRHHMPWLVVSFAAVMFAAILVVEAPLMLLSALGYSPIPASAGTVGAVSISIMAVQLGLGLLAFGWVCRRFERQADSFAVQHLSGLNHPDAPEDDPPRVQVEAVQAMSGALDVIAHLNAVDARRPSWRHGSIAWRKHYLASIAGRSVDDLPIDRLIRTIKRSALIVLALTIVAWWLL